MTIENTINDRNKTCDFPGVSFGISEDGLQVALVCDTAFAMINDTDGRYYLASGWRINKPMSKWTRKDFYSYYPQLKNKEAFINAVNEQADHQRELLMLSRKKIQMSKDTPWGVSQNAKSYADGIIFYETASHGGFHLSETKNTQIPEILRSDAGWYEEDEAWSIVAIHFPHLFTCYERRHAEKTLKNSWPDAYEKIFGIILNPGESREKDRKNFETKHLNDWIVISALISKYKIGFVECIATKGGKRSGNNERKSFLVPESEYKIGRFGFVINEAEHKSYDGPSTF